MNIIKNRTVLINVYFSVLYEKLKTEGLLWFFKKSIHRAAKELLWVILLPIIIVIHFLGFRRVLVRIEHIGHLAGEIDTFIKSKELKLIKKKIFFISPHS